jgi:hypothetical protein
MLLNIAKDLRFTHLALRLGHNFRRHKFASYDSATYPSANTASTNIIDEKLGYAVLDTADLPVVKNALKCTRAIYPPEFVEKDYKDKGKKGPFYTIECNKNDPASKPIFDLATDECILAPVRQYLNATPVIVSVQVWFSPNDMDTADFNSQLFHFDREDYRQIKCFVPIEDIDETCGPMTLVPKAATNQFVKTLWKRGKIPSTKSRFDDSLVERIIPRESLPVCGTQGSIIMVDTTQCLHYGSRTASKPKYHLAFQYITAYSPKVDKVRDQVLKELETGPRFVSTD